MGRVDGWMDGWMNEWIRWVDGWMNEWIRWMDGWMRVDGWVDGWMDGRSLHSPNSGESGNSGVEVVTTICIGQGIRG